MASETRSLLVFDHVGAGVLHFAPYVDGALFFVAGRTPHKHLIVGQQHKSGLFFVQQQVSVYPKLKGLGGLKALVIAFGLNQPGRALHPAGYFHPGTRSRLP